MTAPAGPVFVTARFRTGSTLLWQLLRRSGHFTTYYEPCHDNLPEHVRGDTPAQDSHHGVTSYWDEYRPLLDRLAALHRNAFGICRLSLASSDEWPEFESYLRCLIDRDAARRPVLQMNRVDFRLPWLRARFPEATIVHLFRNPRDQWLSMTRGLPGDRASEPDENTDYDLVAWAVSLSPEFPFLVGPHIRHSYERHYLLWKLSYLMGGRCGDVSLSYDEDLQAEPGRGVTRLLHAIGANAERASELAALIRPPSPTTRPGTPSDADFERMERASDELLHRLGLAQAFGTVPLQEIRRDFGAAWAPFADAAHGEAVRLGSLLFSRLRSRYLDTVTDMRRLGENARNVERALADREAQLRGLTRA